jgi:hypothetical protein
MTESEAHVEDPRLRVHLERTAFFDDEEAARRWLAEMRAAAQGDGRPRARI